MTRQKKVLLHVLGTVEELQEIGLVTMAERLTEQGLRIDPAAMKDGNQN